MKTVQKKIRYALNQQKFLTESEMAGLEDYLRWVCTADDFSTPRHPCYYADRFKALYMLIALRTGARVGEVENLRRWDYFPETGTIFIRGLKGSDEGEVPLPDWLCKLIEGHLRTLKSDKLFEFSRKAAVLYWHKVRPCKKPLKSMRHGFAMRVYAQTKDILLTKRALRHRSINNTMIYVDFLHSRNELRKILF